MSGDKPQNPWGNANNNDDKRSAGRGGPRGGSRAGGGKFIGLAFLAVVALWFASGFYIVNPGEYAVIQRFGAWDRTQAEPGLGYHFPAPIETSDVINVQEIRKMTIGIKSAEDYLFQIRDQENTIKKVAESAIREVVGQTNMFPIITRDRQNVADRTKKIIQDNLDAYEVQNRAEAYREDILPKARGFAKQLEQEAQAYKQSVVAKSNGDAQRFTQVYKAYLSGKDVTKERIYIETMENVLRNANKIILDGDGSNGVVPYLPLNELGRKTGAQ